ncbi:MAG: hypothetical protein ACO1OG_11830 [Devosia sp.]
MELSTVIGDIYDAGSSDRDWLEVGKKLFKCLGADAGSLRVRQADGHVVNVFQASEADESQYTDYYSHIDPLRPAIAKLAPPTNWASAVMTPADLVDEDSYRKTEFYRDFAKPNGQDHMLLGAVGDDDHTVVGFFRDGTPFGADERSTLCKLMPHLQRALQLRRRLHEAEMSARVGYSAFEALPGNAIVVDHDLSVLFANSAAERTLGKRGLPVSMVAVSTGHTSGTKLLVSNRTKANRLRELVQDAAHGGSGGALRIELDTDEDDRVGQLAVLVSPSPSQFAPEEAGHGTQLPVLILISELSRPSAPKPSLLSDLFGLSAAEGAVALALLGGQTAESVARERDVSLETVRSQIRTVLRKTDATNLRDFERIGALLTTLSH